MIPRRTDIENPQAAVETVRISALLIYHSSTKTAKILVKMPETQK
jgi:hypothetical protein